MTYDKIYWIAKINETDKDKVNVIAESIKLNGWIGCPILIYNDQLLTGSHRLAALQQLEADGEDIFDMEVAEDVTDVVNTNYAKWMEEHGWERDIDYGEIGWLLEGSWAEQYKDEIKEW